jgi:hypothetical protein
MGGGRSTASLRVVLELLAAVFTSVIAPFPCHGAKHLGREFALTALFDWAAIRVWRGLVTTRTRTIAVILVGVYLVGAGMLAGMLIDRMRFDRQRSEVLGRYEQALRDWHAYRIALEKGAKTP